MKTRLENSRNLISKLNIIGDASNEYRGAVCKVDTYMKSLEDMFLPASADFNKEPDVYQDIRSCYQKISDLTSLYTLNIHSSLQTYPSSTRRALRMIDAELDSARTEIKNILETLSSSDYDKDRLDKEIDNFLYYLNGIIKKVNQQILLLEILVNDLETFSTLDVLKIKKYMHDILDNIGEGTEQFQNAKMLLEKTQKEIESEISSEINNIITDAVGLVLGIIIAGFTIGVTIASGGSAIPLIFSVIAGLGTVAATCIPLTMDSIELTQLKKDLQKTIDKIDDYEKDILLFTQWESAVEEVDNGMRGMINQFKIITQSWTDVKTGFESILSRVEDSKENTSATLGIDEWKTIDGILCECQTISQETSKKVEALSLAEIKVSDASIELNMTEDQIRFALENSKIVSFTEYMLSA